MWQIPQELAKAWQNGPQRGSEHMEPGHIDIACPNCQRSMVQAPITWNLASPYAYAGVRCVGCSKVANFLMVIRPKTDRKDQPSRNRIFLDPKPRVAANLDPDLAASAPQFVTIYEQVLEAEQAGLSHLVGMGYRKALEFLIKEWLVHNNVPEAEVAKKLLGKCITDHIRDPRIQAPAARAAWLGNDETHYFRKWNDRDLTDLKQLFSLTLHWITADLTTQRFEREMQAP